MKVKHLIEKLSTLDPEDEIVMKNIFRNPIEPDYFMKKIRAYKWKDRVVIDGYERHPEKDIT